MHRHFTQPSPMLSHFFLPRRNKIQCWNGTHFTNTEPLPKTSNQSQQTKVAWDLSSITFWNNKSYYKLVTWTYRILKEALLQVWMWGWEYPKIMSNSGLYSYLRTFIKKNMVQRKQYYWIVHSYSLTFKLIGP